MQGIYLGQVLPGIYFDLSLIICLSFVCSLLIGLDELIIYITNFKLFETIVSIDTMKQYGFLC